MRAKDTPNFIGNRVGVFSMLATMHHTEQFGLGFDVVDALTGPALGPPKSATYRTADVVGLDTMAHVIKTMARHPARRSRGTSYFKAPAVAAGADRQGRAGPEDRRRLLQEGRQGHPCVLDVAKQDLPARPSSKADRRSRRDPGDQGRRPSSSPSCARRSDPQAQFLWAIFRDLFHYAAFHLADIADTARDVDFAMRWGFGWKLGPFETWQAAGWQQVAEWINEDIAAGKAMSRPRCRWVDRSAAHGVHGTDGSYSASANGRQVRVRRFRSTSASCSPIRSSARSSTPGTTVFENDGVRLWTLGDDGIGILSFKTKMHTVSDQRARRRAARDRTWPKRSFKAW